MSAGAAAPEPTPAPAREVQVAVAHPAAVIAPAPKPATVVALASGPTMAAVQQPLTQLLQEIESGWGDNVVALLDATARRNSGAQALARQLDALCDGVRPVKVVKVDLKSEPREGRLVISGQVTLRVRDTSAPTRLFALQAEFSAQGGGPVLTRLAPLAVQ